MKSTVSLVGIGVLLATLSFALPQNCIADETATIDIVDLNAYYDPVFGFLVVSGRVVGVSDYEGVTMTAGIGANTESVVCNAAGEFIYFTSTSPDAGLLTVTAESDEGATTTQADPF